MCASIKSSIKITYLFLAASKKTRPKIPVRMISSYDCCLPIIHFWNKIYKPFNFFKNKTTTLCLKKDESLMNKDPSKVFKVENNNNHYRVVVCVTFMS